VPKTPKSGAGLERNQVPLSAEITCRFRPKSGAGLLRFLHEDRDRTERAVLRPGLKLRSIWGIPDSAFCVF
jgi:hypothetical protein